MEINTILADYTKKLIEYIDSIKLDNTEYQISVPSIHLTENGYQIVINVQPAITFDDRLMDLIDQSDLINFKIDIIYFPSMTQLHLSFNIAPSSRLTYLPTDVLSYEILLPLDYQDILNTCQSSLYLNHICQSDKFWKLKFIHDFAYSPPKPRENDTMRDVYEKSNNLLGFGSNDEGQLSTVGNNHQILINDRPVKIKSIACGGLHSLIIDTHDYVWSFGSNFYGQLGHNNSFPSQVFDIKAKMISCGTFSSLMIDFENNLWVWGDNVYGNLGLGPKGTSIRQPTQIMIKNEPIKALYITSFRQASFIIDTNHHLWVAGSNYAGQLGVESDVYSFTLLKINRTPFQVKAVSRGLNFSLAIDFDDNLWIIRTLWPGQNIHQVIIDNQPIKAKFNVNNYYSPLFIDFDDNLLSLAFSQGRFIINHISETPFKAKYAVGNRTSLFIIDLEDNVWVMGTNIWGQLGLPIRAEDYPLTPLNIKAKTVAVGGDHSLMISMY